MTPDEAIRRLTSIITPTPGSLYPKETEAVRLGIEALRRHKAQECCRVNVIVGPLPGETEE